MGFTQEEITDFEVAVETIGQLMALYIKQRRDEKNKKRPNQDVIDDLNQEISRLFQERNDLIIPERAKIARIRLSYGAAVRALRAEMLQKEAA